MARDVFISYRSEDKAAAERICAGLEQANISCWLAPRDIPVGQEWATAIVESLRQCKAFVLVLSSNSKNAKQISREAELADHQSLPIITFRIEDVQPPPGLVYFLSNIQWLDAFNGQFDSAVARLANTIQQNASSNEDAVQPPNPVIAPPASVPVATPAVPSASPPWKLVAAVIVGVVLVAGAWFVFHPGRKREARAPLVDSSADAKTVADRFLKERDSGDFDAAWNEYGPTFRADVNRANWQKMAEKRTALGIEHQFNGCKPDGSAYMCVYTLLYKDGSAETDTLKLVNGDGGRWVIAGGTIKRLR